MARTNPDAQRFAAWLRPLMLVRDLNQTQLRKLLENAGVNAGRQTVSQWFNGDNVPVPDSVVLIAQILRADPAEALREAGHVRVASLLAGGGTGERQDVEPVDPYIQQVREDPLLPSDVKDKAIAYYLRQKKQAAENTQEFTKALRS